MNLIFEISSSQEKISSSQDSKFSRELDIYISSSQDKISYSQIQVLDSHSQCIQSGYQQRERWFVVRVIVSDFGNKYAFVTCLIFTPDYSQISRELDI